MFKNISNFYNVNDYLYILNAAIIIDVIGIYLSNVNIIKSYPLKKWYKLFGLSAFIADVFSIMIGIIIARFFYKMIFNNFNIILFIILAIIIQLIHDLLFYNLLTVVKKGTNKMLDIFKEYTNDKGSYKILFVDAGMILSTCILASLLANFSISINIFLFIVLFYLAQYFIYN
jgi:uncharacterized protein YacL